jgi:hypothetical protein
MRLKLLLETPRDYPDWKLSDMLQKIESGLRNPELIAVALPPGWKAKAIDLDAPHVPVELAAVEEELSGA